MPIYEYLCPDCKQRFEKVQPMSDVHVAIECPKCNTRGQRVVSPFFAFGMNSGGDSIPVAGNGCTCAGGGSCGCGPR